MKKLALIALAAAFAASGAVSTASAALSDRDGTVWHPKSDEQLVARNGGKADRGDRGGRQGNKSGNKGRIIWRVRDQNHRHFFLFRGRGDCRTEAIQVHDDAGNPVVKQARVCN